MPERANQPRVHPRPLAPKESDHGPGSGYVLVGSTVAGSAETTTQQRSHGGGSEQHTPQLIHHPQLHPSQQFQQQHHQLHRQPQPQPQHSLRDINLYQRLPENGLPLIAPAVSISPQASAVSPTGGYVWATDSTINSQTPQPQNLAMDLPKIKRNCVSNACVHCRKKRSKCDGESPCAKCLSSGKADECRYDVENDHRRKGALRRRNEELEYELKQKEAHMATILRVLRNADEDSIKKIVKRIKREGKLEDIAKSLDREESLEPEPVDLAVTATEEQLAKRPIANPKTRMNAPGAGGSSLEGIGLGSRHERTSLSPISDNTNDQFNMREVAPSSWTKVTDDDDFVEHLVSLYFTWDQPMFMTVPESRFRYDFEGGGKTYCSALLVNAICAVGCHYSDRPEAYENGEMKVEARGRHFRNEAIRLMEQLEDKEKVADLATIQGIYILSIDRSVCYEDVNAHLHFSVLQRLVNKQKFQDVFEGGDPLAKNFAGDREDFEWLFWTFYITDSSWCNAYMSPPANPEFPLPNLPNCHREIEECPWYPYDGKGPYDRSLANLDMQKVVSPMASGHARIKLFGLLHNIDSLLYTRDHIVTARSVFEMYSRLTDWKRQLPTELATIDMNTGPHTITMHMMRCALICTLLKPYTDLRVRRTQHTTPTPLSLATDACKELLGLFRTFHQRFNIKKAHSMILQYLMFFLQIRKMSFPSPDAIEDFKEVLGLLTECADVYPIVKIAILSLGDTELEAQKLQKEEVNTVGLASMLESLNVEDEQELHTAKEKSLYYERLVKGTKSTLADNFEEAWEPEWNYAVRTSLNENVVIGVEKAKLGFLLN